MTEENTELYGQKILDDIDILITNLREILMNKEKQEARKIIQEINVKYNIGLSDYEIESLLELGELMKRQYVIEEYSFDCAGASFRNILKKIGE